MTHTDKEILIQYFAVKFDEIIGAGEPDAIEDCGKVAAELASYWPSDAVETAREYLEENNYA